ncbi:DUF485 domain-containing protein [Aeoliella sp.]|uniref:DUF485 domain-containing protein n=1 Tax=Aeoliella sp. TaxID=2795800 RepID=UPI003CCC3C28
MIERNARIGLVLFAAYVALYGGFMLLNAFAPSTMQWTPALGINLAIWYGFGLIISAVVLALLYGFLCKSNGGQGLDNSGETTP